MSIGGLFGVGEKSFSFRDTAPSWSELDGKLRGVEPVTERSDFDSKKSGRGGSNHKSNLRLFDAPEDFNPKVTLYRDAAAWCPYCEKVWLQLEEKRIPYKIIKNPLSCYGDKAPEFFRVSPSGQLPIAEINGRIVQESNVIMDVLESEFPDYKPLLPPVGSKEREKVTGLLRLERKLFSSWFSWLTSRASGNGASQEMDGLFKTVDAELKASGGPYFLGREISLVDIMYTPFLERMAASLPYFKGFECRSAKYPALLRWYEAMDTRISYQGIKSDYYTHVHDLPPQIGGCHATPEAAPYAAEIDGGAWDVSKAAKDCFEPMLPLDADTAKRDAARNFIDNNVGIIKFACRGAGSQGFPKVRAELADPRANPNVSFIKPVDFALRAIIGAMLEPGSLEEQLGGMQGSNVPIDKVIQSLTYLRDRVGVPRDMTVHGARQLRAHINACIRALERQ